MSSIVLDSSAVLAALESEPGAASVVAALPRAVVCSVNLAEIATVLIRRGRDAGGIRLDLAALLPRTVPFDDDLAFAAASLHPVTRPAGLSLGERSCIALALRLTAPVLTADRAWAGLPLGVDVRLVR